MDNVRKLENAHYKRENITENQLEEKDKNEVETEDKLQWHPAFYAEVQIELEEESENLIFENEHQLGTMPKEIDVLVVKKKDTIPIRKNIGRIFRKYNIIEYKSPEDSLGINDFYKVLGYTYFYKSDTRRQNNIKLESITITFVCKPYPRKLIRHLRKQGNIVEKADEGIWYVKGEKMPIQLIVTSQLSEKKNFWLKYLTNDLKNGTTLDRLIKKYKQHKNDIYYKSVMDIIVRANKKIFMEENKMCDAMMEILQDRIDKISEKTKDDGIRIGEKQGLHLAKMIMRMNADGVDCETIASKCLISVEEVKDVLAF